MTVSITVMQWDTLVMSISNSMLRFGDGWGKNFELNGSHSCPWILMLVFDAHLLNRCPPLKQMPEANSLHVNVHEVSNHEWKVWVLNVYHLGDFFWLFFSLNACKVFRIFNHSGDLNLGRWGKKSSHSKNVCHLAHYKDALPHYLSLTRKVYFEKITIKKIKHPGNND